MRFSTIDRGLCPAYLQYGVNIDATCHDVLNTDFRFSAERDRSFGGHRRQSTIRSPRLRAICTPARCFSKEFVVLTDVQHSGDLAGRLRLHEPWRSLPEPQ